MQRWWTYVRRYASQLALWDGTIVPGLVVEAPAAATATAPVPTDRSARDRYAGAVLVFLLSVLVVRVLLSPPTRLVAPAEPRAPAPAPDPEMPPEMPPCDARYTPRHMAHPEHTDAAARRAVEYALRARMRASPEHPCLSATDLCARHRIVAVRAAGGADVTFLYNPRIVERGPETDAFVLPPLADGLPARAVTATGVITVADAIGAHEYGGARAACIEHAIGGWDG